MSTNDSPSPDPSGSAAIADAQVPERESTPLTMPREGIPDVVDTTEQLRACVTALREASGPVAVDAERASGHRYGQRAFLVQIRRAGAGTFLIDPAALPDLSSVSEAIQDAEWIVHAATQDLACLADVGMSPRVLFDTELGGRIAGYARVGLASMVDNLLGFSLAKEHSAVDWSTRPLPEPWLRYAALDVEILIELRDVLAADLAAQGKLAWAQEEFAAIVAAPPGPPRVDPWRRTSGMHRIRDRRHVLAVQKLWECRDVLAKERDVSPGRLLPDSALVEAAMALPGSAEELHAVPAFSGRGAKRYTSTWIQAIAEAKTASEDDLPPLFLPSDAPPQPRSWPERNPEAATRLAGIKDVMAKLSETHSIPVENIMSPDSLRRIAWEPALGPDGAATEESISAALLRLGARQWQVTLVVPAIMPSILASAIRD